MPVGKDSIRKRVIHTEGETAAADAVSAVEVKAETDTAPADTAAVAATATATVKPTSAAKPAASHRPGPGRPRKTSAAKAAAKPAAPVTDTPAIEAAAPKADTDATAENPVAAVAVMGNVSPEVVEKVTGHAEKLSASTVVHVQITHEMPDYLL